MAVITRTHAPMVAATAYDGVDARHHGVRFARNVETGIAATAKPRARSGRSTVRGWLRASTTRRPRPGKRSSRARLHQSSTRPLTDGHQQVEEQVDADERQVEVPDERACGLRVPVRVDQRR